MLQLIYYFALSLEKNPIINPIRGLIQDKKYEQTVFFGYSLHHLNLRGTLTFWIELRARLEIYKQDKD